MAKDGLRAHYGCIARRWHALTVDRSSPDVGIDRFSSRDVARRGMLGFTPTERRNYEAATLRYMAAAHISNYLDNAGIPAKDLAQRIRKSRSWISKLLSGRQNATLDTLAEVAWALGAKWSIDLVAASRSSTPAEDDPPPPSWAVHQPNASTVSLTVISGSAIHSSFELPALMNVDFRYIQSTVLIVNVITGPRWLDSLRGTGAMNVISPSVQANYAPSGSPTIITEVEPKR